MASWIVHLRVADGLLERFPSLRPTEFILGNVAPDSGIPGEGYTFTPPKRVSHFQRSYGGHSLSGYDSFASEYLSEKCRNGCSADALSFHLGYFTHLLTDYHWAIRIAIPLSELEPENYFRDRPGTAAKWKRDWYGQDFIYLREHPDFRAYRLLIGAEGVKNRWLGFFPTDAFELLRKRIAEFYSHPFDDTGHEYVWLTREQADSFVADITCLAAKEIEKYI